MAIETAVPYSDGWWLQKLYQQLRLQQKRCQELQNRYEGNSPLPMVSDTQNAAVKWFVEKSRTNFERLIVNAVLAKMRLVGVRTTADDDDGGDADAWSIWRKSHGKLWSRDVHKMMLAMSMGYVIVGKDADGALQVTAEDPRLVTAITDPANPYKVLAALKLYHDDVNDEDVAMLYLPGRLAVAKRPRKARVTTDDVKFSAAAFSWDASIINEAGELAYESMSGDIPELQEVPGELPALVPVVPFINEDGMAQFEPFLHLIDRINQQILQRMTIATVQAFKQRAFKGLPQFDPKTGEKINYDAIFTADPGAIWNVPKDVDIQELGQADLQQILLAIRDDVKDLAATSGTPLYSVTPDVANGSAEGASLQRETANFIVEARIDRVEPAHEKVFELIFRTLGGEQVAKAQPGTMEVIWAPIDRPSMTERANAIAQTKDVISRYQQSTEIWGFDPAQADRNATELVQDFIQNQRYQVNAKPQTQLAPVNGDSSSAA